MLFLYPLLFVCYFKGSHVDIALGSHLSYRFNVSPIVFSSGFMALYRKLYIE